ncbi:MAG: sulfite exporter TauE/SafE family protein [Elusimicrobiota bacterium]
MDIILLSIAFFPISMVGVSTGGLSLINVPLLIFAGLPPRQAIATNMLGLTFMSISGAAGFAKEIKKLSGALIIKLSLVTAVASFLGARIVLMINENVLKNIIAVVVLGVTILVYFSKNLGVKQLKTGRARRFAGWILVFILGIYGGFFSGGYITMLTYAFLFFWGMTFVQAVGITKVLNIFSSGAATIYFIYTGTINFRYGIPLAAVMFAGGYTGAKIAALKGNNWLRYIFLSAAAAMGIAILIFK